MYYDYGCRASQTGRRWDLNQFHKFDQFEQPIGCTIHPVEKHWFKRMEWVVKLIETTGSWLRKMRNNSNKLAEDVASKKHTEWMFVFWKNTYK